MSMKFNDLPEHLQKLIYTGTGWTMRELIQFSPAELWSICAAKDPILLHELYHTLFGADKVISACRIHILTLEPAEAVKAIRATLAYEGHHGDFRLQRLLFVCQESHNTHKNLEEALR